MFCCRVIYVSRVDFGELEDSMDFGRNAFWWVPLCCSGVVCFQPKTDYSDVGAALQACGDKAYASTKLLAHTYLKFIPRCCPYPWSVKCFLTVGETFLLTHLVHPYRWACEALAGGMIVPTCFHQSMMCVLVVEIAPICKKIVDLSGSSWPYTCILYWSGPYQSLATTGFSPHPFIVTRHMNSIGSRMLGRIKSLSRNTALSFERFSTHCYGYFPNTSFWSPHPIQRIVHLFAMFHLTLSDIPILSFISCGGIVANHWNSMSLKRTSPSFLWRSANKVLSGNQWHQNERSCTADDALVPKWLSDVSDHQVRPKYIQIGSKLVQDPNALKAYPKHVQ